MQPDLRIKLISNPCGTGEFSQSQEVQQREPTLLHPDKARARCISDGDILWVNTPL